MTPPWAVVIGVGNEFRRDDGIGPAVVAELQRRTIPGVRMMIAEGEPTRLLDAWTDVRLAVAIDAVVCESSTPGRCHRMTMDELPPATGAAGTHGFGLGGAVALGRVLERMPQQLIVYAIEVSEVSYGVGLSTPVAAALPTLVEAVLGELDCARLPAGRPWISDGRCGRRPPDRLGD